MRPDNAVPGGLTVRILSVSRGFHVRFPAAARGLYRSLISASPVLRRGPGSWGREKSRMIGVCFLSASFTISMGHRHNTA